MSDCRDSWFRAGTGIWIVPFSQVQTLKQAGNDPSDSYRNLKVHKLVPVESIHPGDFVITHNRKLAQVVEKTSKNHTGIMTGIRHAKSEKTLWLCGEHPVLSREKTVAASGDNFWKLFPVDLFKKIKVNNKTTFRESTILWEFVQNEQLGALFSREHAIGPFIADFYSESRKIIIEIDEESQTRQGAHYRTLMDSFFRARGITVLRYTQEDILHDMPNTLRHIKSVLLQRIQSAFRGKEWVRADALEQGDHIYTGLAQNPSKISEIEYDETREALVGIRIDRPGSCLTEVAAVYCPTQDEPA